MGPVRLVVGIAGGSASGKTTLAHALTALLLDRRTALLHHDDYYLDHRDRPPAERARLNFDHPSALDNRRLAQDLRALRAGRAILAPRYDFRTHARLAEPRRVEPADIVLVEGVLLLAVPCLRRLLDVRLFVDAPADLRLAGRLRRDLGPERGRTAESVIEQYLATVRPMHERYVEPSKMHADLVVTDASDAREVRRAVRLLRARLGRSGPGASCIPPRSPSHR